MTERSDLVRWLEDDGHSGCAEALALASDAHAPKAALEAAGCCDTDPFYTDDIARHLPTLLRQWAAEREGSETQGEIPCDTCGRLLTQGDSGNDYVVLGPAGGIFCRPCSKTRLAEIDTQENPKGHTK